MNAIRPKPPRARRRRTLPRVEPRLPPPQAPRVARSPVMPGSRPAPRRRRGGLGPAWPVASALLHLGLFALIFLAAWRSEKPPEPLPPPAYAMVFESGAPERPAEQPSDASPGEPEPPAPALPPSPPMPPPALAAPLPLPPPPMPVPPPPAPREAPPAPETAPPVAPRLAEVPPPLPLPPPPMPEVEAIPAPPRQPVPPRPEPVPPRPPEAPRLAEALPLPPPPMPAPPPPRPQPQQQAQPQPPLAERLPGPYLPAIPQFSPPSAERRAPQGLRGLDLSLGPTVGRMTPEPQMDIRGAQVGPDWRNAFRRWLEEHKRYPQEAIVLNQQGITRIQIVAAPDGRVIGAKLVRRSGSIWLDNNTEQLFRGARLPPFPPGADPNGVNIDLTIHYILIRQ